MSDISVPSNSVKEEVSIKQEDKKDTLSEEKKPYYIGSHVSIAGGLYHAPQQASYLGANAFALFLKSQKQWNMKEISKEDVTKFKEMCEKKHISSEAILPHASYLSNLGQPDDEKLEKSYNAFLGECQRAEELGLKYINIHPGSTVNKCEPEESIKRIASCINRIHKLTSSVTIVLENTAGGGNTIGISLEQLNSIIKQVENKDRVGVCIDTCHAHASGIDITTKGAVSKLLDEFDKIIGIKFLKGMHLNDSMDVYGNRKDRHQCLGKGTIGLETFRQIMNEDRCRGIPLILETPVAERDNLECNKNHPWAYEIELLRQLQGQDSVPKDISTTVNNILKERVDVIDEDEKPKRKSAPRTKKPKKEVTPKKTTKKTKVVVNKKKSIKYDDDDDDDDDVDFDDDDKDEDY